MMKRRQWCLIGALVLIGSAAAWAQEASPAIRVLLIDETKTFTSTMKVAATIGALRQTGLLDVSVRLSDETNDFADPLEAITRDAEEAPFDLILILPRGLDTKTDVNIWLVSDGLGGVSPGERAAVEAISGIVDLVFEGSGVAVDVSEDLWPGLLGAAYRSKGWLR